MSGLLSASHPTFAFLSNNQTVKSLDIHANFAYASWNSGANSFVTNPWVRSPFVTWANTMPASFQQLIKSSGFNTIRMVIDPGPFIMAVANTNAPENISALMTNYIFPAVDSVIAANSATQLKCVVDMHVRPQASVQATGIGLTDQEIVNAAPNSIFWTNYVSAIANVGSLLDARYGGSQANLVSFEVFNEPPPSGNTQLYPTVWANAVPILFKAVRQATPRLTIWVAGDKYALYGGTNNLTGLPWGVTAIENRLFDNNTGFVFHDYNPYMFTYQFSGTGSGYFYLNGMEYPANSSLWTNNYNNAVAAINNDPTVNTTNQALYANAANGALNNYYNSSFYTNLVSDYTTVTLWANAHSIANNRIWLGEFGCTTNANTAYNLRGLHSRVSDSAIQQFYSDVTQNAATLGIGWGLWSGSDPGSFCINNGYTFKPGLRMALGLTEYYPPPNTASFTANNGFDISVLGFAEGTLYNYTNSAFDTAISNTRIAMMKNQGYDFVRLVVDPSPALNANTAANTQAQINIPLHAINTLTSFGMNVILDLHVGGGSGETTWTVPNIINDYPNGPKWLRYLTVAGMFANSLLAYPTNQVAIEQFNETTIAVGNGWPAMAQSVWSAIRAQNANVFVYVSGAGYASIGGLQELNANNFDSNTGFIVHTYDPQIFTSQGIYGTPEATVTRLSYPAVRSEQANAISGQNNTVTGYLNTYFTQGNMGFDQNYLSNTVLANVTTWSVSSNVANSRILFSEYGCHGDTTENANDLPGGSLVSRAKWYQDVTLTLHNAGFAKSIWCYNQPNNVFDFTNSWVPDPAFAAAIGSMTTGDLWEFESFLLFGRMSVVPSQARQSHINAVIRLLKQAGIWTTLDAFYLLGHYNSTAAYPSADAMLNWRANQFNLTSLGTGTWTTNLGWSSDGSTGYLDTNLAPASTANSICTQNSCSIAIRRSGALSSNLQVAAIGNSQTNLALKNNGIYGSVMDSAGGGSIGISTFNMTDVTVGLTRNDGNGTLPFYRGSIAYSGASQLTETAKVSTTPSATSLKIGRYGTTVYADPTQTHKCVAIAQGLSNSQMRDLMTIIDFAVDGLSFNV